MATTLDPKPKHPFMMTTYICFKRATWRIFEPRTARSKASKRRQHRWQMLSPLAVRVLEFRIWGFRVSGLRVLGF